MSEIIVRKDDDLGGVEREYKVTQDVATDVIRVEGKRYRLAEEGTKADTGDKVLVVNKEPKWGGYANGDIFSVTGVYFDCSDLILVDGEFQDGSTLVLNFRECRVLIPLDADHSPQDRDEIIANLTRRVHELESGQKALYQMIEKQRKINDDTSDKLDDIVTLDERSRPRSITINSPTIKVDNFADLLFEKIKEGRR